jgi:FlaA1/EpsC-like NDP-sugar epimerase
MTVKKSKRTKISKSDKDHLNHLLGREEVNLDTKTISEHIKNKTVMITGAGGSIGSEICRQVIKFSPRKVILLDHGEYLIYKIEQELTEGLEQTFELVTMIADIKDRSRMFEIFEEYKPEIVYHAAAYKHVPLLEKNPRAAFNNNVLGSKNIAEAAKKNGTKIFVMVSTDKAVNPKNVMGATKRIAEMLISGMNEKEKTKFISVRFGNVLNSSGSVLPAFKKQIQNGGPVKVTDFRMTRYFMTISEASCLVLQASALATGGEVFVLDMGEPVKILELAKYMIALSGYSEKEIEIIESGARPGEKLHEEYLIKEEHIEQQPFNKIFVGKVCNFSLENILNFINGAREKSNGKLKKSLISFANEPH